MRGGGGVPRQTLCIERGKRFECDEMAGGHVVRWSQGGKTVPGNCQIFSAFDNGSKGTR